jgi:AcrR family transcriptional regulator
MGTSDRPLTRIGVIDAAARVLARSSDHRMLWAAIAREAGGELAPIGPDPMDPPHTGLAGMDRDGFGNVEELIDECYARTAQAFMDSLLQAETAPGTALDQVAAFLVAILEIRRQRGTLLSFRRGRDLPTPLQRRLHERDMMVRMRLKRILSKGRREGSLALRNSDSACELILASLQVADIAAEEPEQRMWDSELVEFLLAALSPMHETRTFCSRCGYVTSVGELRAGSLQRHEHGEA